MLRTAKPKLSLSVPTASHSGPKSPFPMPQASPAASPSSVNSPTARNTLLNQRGYSTAQHATFAYAQSGNTKSILKRGATAGATGAGRRIQFNETPSVRCVSPMPEGYHGEYVKMSRDEKRWGTGRS